MPGVLDTLDVAQALRGVRFPEDQAAEIAKAVGLAADRGDHVTRDQLKADLAELRANLGSELVGVRTDVAKLETRLIRWLVGVVLGAATLSVAVVAALLRFWLAGG